MKWNDILKRYSDIKPEMIHNFVGSDLQDWVEGKEVPTDSEIKENRAEFDRYVNHMESLYKQLEEKRLGGE